MQPEEMAQVLRQAVREGVLRPGQPLVQEDLAKRFNVSRIPVREALRMLAGEGLVTARPRGGAAVRVLTGSEVAELYDLRLAIEPALAPHIVQNARPNDIKRWRDWIHQLDSFQVPEWIKTNYKFHSDMYSIAEKPHTYRIILSILDFTQQYSRFYMETSESFYSSNEEHRQMVNAIEACDAEALKNILSTHLTTARDKLKTFLANRPAYDAMSALRSL